MVYAKDWGGFGCFVQSYVMQAMKKQQTKAETNLVTHFVPDNSSYAMSMLLWDND